MCNSHDPTWAVSCLSVLLRAMQGRTDNYKTAIQLNDAEVSLLTDLYRIRRSCYRLHEVVAMTTARRHCKADTPPNVKTPIYFTDGA
jgi:hypothetical protein